MDTLPTEMIFEIVKHLHGDEMVKFSMVNKQICLSCFRKISLVDHYEDELCDECMNGVIDHEFDMIDDDGVNV
jgi:hypothetical protein